MPDSLMVGCGQPSTWSSKKSDGKLTPEQEEFREEVMKEDKDKPEIVFPLWGVYRDWKQAARDTLRYLNIGDDEDFKELE